MTRDEVDLRPVALPVRQQGSRPLCLPFATSLAHAISLGSAGSDPEELAPEAIWAHAYRNGRTFTDGMFLRGVDPALREDGQPLLTEWPYDETLGYGTEAPPAGLVAPWRLASVELVDVYNDGDEAAIEAELADGIPLVLVVAITDGFYFPKRGLVEFDSDQPVEGYHAVTCLGAIDHTDGGRSLLVQNSWGTGWGLSGRAALSSRYVERHLSQAAKVVALASQ